MKEWKQPLERHLGSGVGKSMVELIQPSFTKGELSPALYGRIDTTAYQSGLKTARNVIIHPHGGVSNRPGTIFIGPAKEHTYAPRLIPFKFKTTDQYILEFGNKYMRVIRDDGHVLETAKTITAATAANPVVVTSAAHGFVDGDEVYITTVLGMTELNGNRYVVASALTDTFALKHQASGADINGLAFTAYTSGGTAARIFTLVTPYVTADLNELKTVQSADVMTIVHKNYAPRELARTGHTSWTLSVLTFAPLISFPTGVVVTKGEVGAASVSYRVTAISKDTSEESLPGLNDTVKDITAATVASPVVITATSHGFANGDEVHISNIVGMTELNDRRFIVANKAANTFELEGENGLLHTAYVSGGDVSQTFVKIVADVITGATAATPVVVTIGAGHGFAVNEVVNISGVVGMVELNNRAFTVSVRTATTISLQDPAGTNVNGTTYTAYDSLGSAWKTPSDNVITWNAVSGARSYAVYKNTNGLYGWIGETETTTFTDYNLAVNLSISPPRARNPFFGVGNYPGTVSYFEQRRVFGGSTNSPDTSWYSKTGSYNNFTSSSPIQADDAITASLVARQVNEIRHFVPMNDLIIFTSGSEWRINAGPDAAFSAESIKQKPQSFWGVSHNLPVVVGNTILFIDDGEMAVRSFGFSLQLDGYTGSNLALLASHLFSTYTITDWDFSRCSEPRIHLVRSDGKALSMTFDQEQEVVAWTTWDTLGSFERVAILQHAASSAEDGVFFVVKRKINGNTVRYIERVSTRNFVDVRDAFFVDCGLSLNSPVVITNSTVANPVVVTAPAHGFANGDEVDISDVIWESVFDSVNNETQPDQLNGQRFVVANATTNTFELTGKDGTAFNAYVSGGTVRLAVATVTGLEHLEGRAVSILSNGNVISGKTVTNGAITLTDKASRIHVGLKYISDVETLNIEAQASRTVPTIQGISKKIPKVVIRFERSRGLLIGPDSANLIEMKQREYEDIGDPIALLTGDKEIILLPSWNTNGRLLLRQSYPLPMTILAVIPDVVLSV